MNRNRLGWTCGPEQRRHDEQREPAQEVVAEEQVARVDPVGQPARGDGADDVEDADQREQAGRAWSAGMPWSWAAGMKWVPISPLVDQPQIQKVAEQDPEGPATAHASRRVRRAPARRRHPGRRGRPVGSTYDRRARRRARADVGRAGRAARPARAGTSSSAKHRPRPAAAHRQPGPSARWAISGQEDQLAGGARRREDAGDQAAVPRRTSGWRRSRRRPGPSTPVPTPTAKPQRSHSCQALGHHHGQAGAERRPATSAAATTRRTPNRSISAAANGAVRP